MKITEPRPPRLARWLLRLRPLGSRRSEIDADLREAFVERVAHLGRRRAARRYYLDVLSVWRWNPSGAAWASGVAQDLTHASRVFRRSPGSVAVTVLGLSLAIALSTSIFTLLNAAVFRGLGISDPASAVRVLRAQKNGISSGWTFAEYRALRESPSGAAVEAVLRDGARFSAMPVPPNDAGGQSVQMTFVGGGYLGAFGARAAVGRLLTSSDDAIGAAPAVIISHGFWTRRLGADPAIAGRQVWLNGVPVTIVGVAASPFTGFSDQAPAFWAPFSTYHVLYSGSPLSHASQTIVNLYGRIAKGARIEQAEAELSAAAAALSRGGPLADPATGVRLEPAGSRFRNAAELRTVTLVVAMVLTVMGLVLVLACVNVANLQLASAVARHREIAVRLAVGASRGRIVRQLLTESLVLGVAAGAVAFVLTAWILPVITTAVRAPVTMDVAPDFRVYLFLALISLASGLGAGLAPARHGTRGDLMTPLKGESRGGESHRPGRLRSTLIGVQAAASIVLLIFAALLTRATMRALRVDVGFDAYHLVTVAPAFGRERYDEGRTRAYWQQTLERMRGLAGARAASLADYPPYGGASGVAIMERDGRRFRTTVSHTDAEYFSTLGLRIVRGRAYTPAEVLANAPVALVSEAMAREFWPGVDPVGRSLEQFDGNSGITVIGVASDAITARLRELGSATLYRPMAKLGSARMLVRTSGPPEAMVPAIRDALQPLDPRVRLDINLVATGLQRELDEPRILASLAGALAAFALGLAIVGIYGVTSFVAGQRTREIGLRIAIGATTADVMRLLLMDSLRPVAIGLTAGAVAALLLTRVFGGILYGVGSHDPAAFGGAVVVLLAAAAAAVYVPTRRAAGVDPAFVLRQS
jgi:predicted permease